MKSLITRYGLENKIIAMRESGSSHKEIADWITEECGDVISRVAVTRWFGRNAVDVSSSSPSTEKVERQLDAVRHVKLGRDSEDAVYFIEQLRAIVGDMRVLYNDPASHPQLRAKAADLAVTAAIEGHDLVVDSAIIKARFKDGR